MGKGGLTLARYLLHITGTFDSVFKYFCGRYHQEKNCLTLILFERTEVVLQLGFHRQVLRQGFHRAHFQIHTNKALFCLEPLLTANPSNPFFLYLQN